MNYQCKRLKWKLLDCWRKNYWNCRHLVYIILTKAVIKSCSFCLVLSQLVINLSLHRGYQKKCIFMLKIFFAWPSSGKPCSSNRGSNRIHLSSSDPSCSWSSCVVAHFLMANWLLIFPMIPSQPKMAVARQYFFHGYRMKNLKLWSNFKQNLKCWWKVIKLDLDRTMD